MANVKLPQHRIEHGAFSLYAPEIVLRSGVLRIKGPNGCGKSSYIRWAINSVAETNSQISLGYVPQHYDDALFSWLSVLNNLAVFGLSESASLQMLTRLNVPSDVFNSRPRELSGGQRQKVAIARELLLSPQILFFDEPFASLDQGAVELVSTVIADYALSIDATIVLASHIMPQNARLKVTDTLAINSPGTRDYTLVYET